jgi:hypothetical protein
MVLIKLDIQFKLENILTNFLFDMNFKLNYVRIFLALPCRLDMSK